MIRDLHVTTCSICTRDDGRSHYRIFRKVPNPWSNRKIPVEVEDEYRRSVKPDDEKGTCFRHNTLVTQKDTTKDGSYGKT